MATGFALLITPEPADVTREDFSDTFNVIDPSAPALSVGELSTQRGDGIFESIGVVNAHPQEVEPHLDRLAHSAQLCELPQPNREQWRQAIAVAAAECGAGESVIKLILSRGIEHGPAPTAWVTASRAADFAQVRTAGVSVVTLDRGIDSGAPARAPWLLLGAKTLSYAVNMAAIRAAHARGADDAVFVTSDGILLEAPTASVVLRMGERYVTPEPGAGILHGTTQISLFTWLAANGHQVSYERLPADALETADAAWLVSSVRLAAPVHHVNGIALAVDHALTAAMNNYLLTPRD